LSEADVLSRELLAAARTDPGRFERLASALAALDPLAIGGDQTRTAFWINLYNALVLAELGRHPQTGSLLRHRGIFRTTSQRVGGYDYSPDVIEHGLLRGNARVPFSFRRALGRRDPRLAAAPSRRDPRIHFALNCGAISCPPIRTYTAERLDEDLELTTAAYMRAETAIDRERGRIELPYLLRLYRPDFGGRTGAREFAAGYLEAGDDAWVREREPAISFRRFDWTFAER
jgi:uncharacterized protein DUF547